MSWLVIVSIAVFFNGMAILSLTGFVMACRRAIRNLQDQLVASRLSVAKMGDCYRLLADNVRTVTNRIIHLEDAAADEASAAIAHAWPRDKAWVTGRLNEIEGLLTGFSQSWLEGIEPLEGEG